MAESNFKLCGWCGEYQAHGRNKGRWDGLANGCKKCRSAAQVKYHQVGGGKEAARLRRVRYKIAAFNAYGGCLCSGCGEQDLAVLSIDHIKGGGGKHRQEVGANFYYWLKANRYPDGYRVLCMNCQFRAKVGKPLPHEGRS